MPSPVYPAPLLPGHRIAVTAPSSGVQAPLHARLNLVLQQLRNQGFVVEEGQCLRRRGWFDHLTGVLAGRSAAPDSTGEYRLRYQEALRTSLAGLSVPVLVDLDIGHRPPQMLLINGALAQVQWAGPGTGSVTQRLV